MRGNTYRIARVALTALAAMLVVSIAITFLIGSSKLSSAQDTATESARVLVQENLTAAVTGADLVAPVSDARARQIDEVLQETILRGDIDAVTIWNPDGTIVFSSDHSLIGTRLPEERDRLKEILKVGATSRVQDGMFSTQVPLAPEGTDLTAVAQLDRVYAPIWNTAARPWRTASLASGVALLAILGAIWQVTRMATKQWKVYAGTTFQSLRGKRGAPALGGGNGTDPTYTQPDFRQAEEMLKHAEDRATTAEERAAALQEQYRKTLEELHTATQQLEGAALETPSRPDPEIEERLLKAEGRVRLLEGQLHAVKSERQKLASDLQEAKATPAVAPDPKIEQRAKAAEDEATVLRTELEGARHELAGVVKELESARREKERLASASGDAAELQAVAE
ncbi:MAG: hypothetical protein M3O84_09445, partial [Actinomycetota bacterium]|nr:hypothetical protein [Actinomycetota bacterium]